MVLRVEEGKHKELGSGWEERRRKILIKQGKEAEEGEEHHLQLHAT